MLPPHAAPGSEVASRFVDVRLAPLDAEGFRPLTATAAQVYGEAMRRSPEIVVQRREVIGIHLDYPGFVASVAFAEPPAQPGTTEGTGVPVLVGFGYGYRGASGQWWHDIVSRALGREGTRRWLADGFELAELHVRPDYHGQGVGRGLLRDVMARAGTAHVTLSTPDSETAARALYRSEGYIDLLQDFYFPGSVEPYAVMGVDL
jgi:ribosomal protein S18 acetylase RimI-like enzyme